MPWVDENDCVGCGICVEKCRVNAISMVDTVAKISMEMCIRCGVCHSVCPQNAVKHDSEKLQDEIEANVKKVNGYLKHYDSKKDKELCVKRSMNYFRLQKNIAEKTLERLEKMKN